MLALKNEYGQNLHKKDAPDPALLKGKAENNVFKRVQMRNAVFFLVYQYSK